jgi:hypothetical protein
LKAGKAEALPNFLEILALTKDNEKTIDLLETDVKILRRKLEA